MSDPSGELPHRDWLVPDWPAPPGVFALCTTRAGGVSRPPFASLNLGTHVGDDPAAVHANRQRLQAALAKRAAAVRPVFLNQVHGDGVAHLAHHTPDGTEADACVASEPGVACTIMVADCLPVLLAHRSGQVVAAAHAGWRGLAGTAGRGVLEAVFERFRALAHMDKARQAIESGATASQGAASWESRVAQETVAWLGPCIGPQAFEVGTDVRDAFCSADRAAAACFTPIEHTPGKFLCDLAALARLRLRAMGITQVHGNDSTPPWCTASNASRFFSHRRDAGPLGGSGRLAACVWIG
jgi:copper oxidase (laccase) domain-containing protein